MKTAADACASLSPARTYERLERPFLHQTPDLRLIAELITARLAPEGREEPVLPGDVLEIERGAVRVLPQASPFVRHVEGGGETAWEPIDVWHFSLCSSESDRVELAERLDTVLYGPWAKWIAASLNLEGGIRHRLLELGAIYQLIVHSGEGRRLHYSTES